MKKQKREAELKEAFRQGLEEGFVRAAELSGNPEAILRQFRPVKFGFVRSLMPAPVPAKKRERRSAT